MTERYSNKTGYSIPRSFKPVVFQTVLLVFISDALLLFSLLLFAGLRNALGVEAELIALTIVLFGVKTVITIYGVYKMLQSWLGVSYFVVNNKLYIQSEIRSVSSSVFHLSDISKAEAGQSYRASKRQDYGTVKISFARGASLDTIELKGVKDPDTFAIQLSK